MARALVALAAAAAAALLLAVPEIYGIATWKWVLFVIGFLIFAAGRRK